MVTEAWARVRPRFAALFGRDQEEDVSSELDEIQLEISEDPELSAGEATQWKRRLRRALLNNPEAVAELQSILDEFSPRQTEQPANVLHNDLKGATVSGGIVIQAGTITARNIGT